MQLTPKQEKKIRKIANIVKNGNLAVAEYLFEMEETFDEALNEIKKSNPALEEILVKIKGDTGERGEKGDTGEQGDSGTKGEKGEQGISGRDGLSGRDGKDGIDGSDGLDGKDGRDGKDGKDGRDGKDAPVFDIKSIKKEIEDVKSIALTNSLPITTSFFNGLRAKNLNVVGANAVQSGDTVFLTIPSSGGTGFTVLLSTETPDGTTTVFTFPLATSKPSFIISDNAQMRATSKSGTVNWTWNSGTNQATMTIPPQDDLVAIQ